jgi:DUF4097 and DUF4098 domain-containing protein YvlB
MGTHHTPAGLHLKLRIASGRCEIETADTDETVVYAEPLNGSSASREAVENLVEELRELPDGGSELLVEVPRKRRFIANFNQASVLVRVRGPHGLHVDAACASADVIARGRLGSADVRTASGDVSIDHVDGQADVKTASGDVEISDLLAGGAVHTMSGDVAVRRVRTAFAAYTMSGDVRIGSVGAGSVELRSMSGDLRVAIARGATLYVDATSTSGDVRSELPVTSEAPAGPADVRLSATSLSGDILVTRAAEPAEVA